MIELFETGLPTRLPSPITQGDLFMWETGWVLNGEMLLLQFFWVQTLFTNIQVFWPALHDKDHHAVACGHDDVDVAAPRPRPRPRPLLRWTPASLWIWQASKNVSVPREISFRALLTCGLPLRSINGANWHPQDGVQYDFKSKSWSEL